MMIGQILGTVFILSIVAFLYLLPMFVARGKQNRAAITVLNVLLGWTFLGWVGALIWAMVAKPEEITVPA